MVMDARRENGFTLVELMIVVVIIGILASIAIPKFGQLVTRSKVVEAKQILHQIIDLENTYYHMWGNYQSFGFDTNCNEIDFTQPDASVRRFEYKFDVVGAAPFENSIATAMENQDVNGDGDTDDGLTLTVGDVKGSINDLLW